MESSLEPWHNRPGCSHRSGGDGIAWRVSWVHGMTCPLTVSGLEVGLHGRAGWDSEYEYLTTRGTGVLIGGLHRVPRLPHIPAGWELPSG